MARYPLSLLLAMTMPLAFATPPAPTTLNGTKMVFTFECARLDPFSKARLESLTQRALAGLPDRGVNHLAERAVAADLDADGVPEYFVPLTCGATCNCTWAVFGGSPMVALGLIDGCVIRVLPISSGWANVVTYQQMSAGDGVLTSYTFRQGSYHSLAGQEISWADAAAKVGCSTWEKCCK